MNQNAVQRKKENEERKKTYMKARTCLKRKEIATSEL